MKRSSLQKSKFTPKKCYEIDPRSSSEWSSLRSLLALPENFVWSNTLAYSCHVVREEEKDLCKTDKVCRVKFFEQSTSNLRRKNFWLNKSKTFALKASSSNSFLRTSYKRGK